MITRRDFGTLLTGAACGAAFPALAPAPAARPNIVVIFADDLGYGDLGCYGHPIIRTPNLDRMAQEGMRFTQFYSAAPVCTPSRVALMTGRLPGRSGLTRVLNPKSTGGLAASEITIAEALKPLGYATVIVGKWHLGHRPEYLPTRHGFDSYFGIPYSNDMSPMPLVRDDQVIEEKPDQNFLTQRYTEEATKFIRASTKARKPFFAYLPHTFPHVPLHASPKFRGKSPRGLYGDVVEELDWSVGEVLKTLRETGADRNTLVVFSSDNGPWLVKKQDGGSAGLLREGKASTWEGGMREPFLARWPGRIPANVVTPAFGTLMDIFPTAVKISGAKMPADREYDGADLSPVLFENSPGREPLHFYYNAEDLRAARKGPWKLHLATNEPATGGGLSKHEPPLLYNLTVDPSEKYNVAAENPAVLQELLALAARHRQTMKFGELQR